jgi:tetratricopeptide (TPR) repeat protein
VRPPSEASASRIAALRTRLADALARRRAGRYAEARTLTDALARDAEPLAYPPLTAEILALRGMLEERTGDRKKAADTLREAIATAELGRHDRARAMALTELMLVQIQLSHFDDALSEGQLASAALTRAGGDPELEIRLDEYKALDLQDLERFDEAVALMKSVVARRERRFGPDAIEVGSALINIGETQRAKGDLSGAIASINRAIAISQKPFSDQHPQVAIGWNNLGVVLFYKLDYRGAAAAFDKALTIRRSTLGDEHPETASSMNNLAAALTHLGESERALQLAERALAIRSRVAGPNRADTADSEQTLANALLSAGRLDEALAHAERALAIRQQAFDNESAHAADALGTLGHIHLARHETKLAILVLERSLALLEKRAGPPHNLADARFTLAKALWVSGAATHARARSLATAALDGADGDPDGVGAWLRQHP